MKSNNDNINSSPDKIDIDKFAGVDNNEDLESDLYLFALQKKLNQMRKDRKKADSDALLLKNRLNLLKCEEDKVI